MNTFAVILLAFPFFLATKGKLVAYVALAKKGGGQVAATGSPASAASASGFDSGSTKPSLLSLPPMSKA